jgi:urea transporter
MVDGGALMVLSLPKALTAPFVLTSLILFEPESYQAIDR